MLRKSFQLLESNLIPNLESGPPILVERTVLVQEILNFEGSFLGSVLGLFLKYQNTKIYTEIDVTFDIRQIKSSSFRLLSSHMLLTVYRSDKIHSRPKVYYGCGTRYTLLLLRDSVISNPFWNINNYWNTLSMPLYKSGFLYMLIEFLKPAYKN